MKKYKRRAAVLLKKSNSVHDFLILVYTKKPERVINSSMNAHWRYNSLPVQLSILICIQEATTGLIARIIFMETRIIHKSCPLFVKLNNLA